MSELYNTTDVSEFVALELKRNNEEESKILFKRLVAYAILMFVMSITSLSIAMQQTPKLIIAVLALLTTIILLVLFIGIVIKYIKVLISAVFQAEFEGNTIELVNKTSTCEMFINGELVDVYEGFAAIRFQLSGEVNELLFVVKVTAYTRLKAKLYCKRNA